MPLRWLAVLASLAVLAFGVAACGSSERQHQRRLVGERTSRGRSPGRARPPRRRRRKPGSPNSRTKTPARRSPMTRSGRVAGANSSSPAASPSRAATRRSKTEEGEIKRRCKRCEPGEAGRGPGLRLADRGHLQPRRASKSCSSTPETAGEDLQPGNHHLERPGDRQRQPGRRTARHPHHPGQPLGRVGHDGELHRIPLPGRPQRLDVRSQRRLAGQGRRGRRGHLRRGRSGHRRRRRDRLRRRQPGRRTRRRQDQGRQRVRRTDARGRGEGPRGVARSQGTEPGHSTCSPSNSTARPNPGHLPDRAGLLPDRLHQVRLGSRSGASSRRYFEYVDQLRRPGRWPPKTPARRRSRAP